jgi:hypothetical protein
MSERSALQIGVDLFDDRVCPVCLVRRDGTHHGLIGGEERVVPVGAKQRWLLRLLRVQLQGAPHPELSFRPVR